MTQEEKQLLFKDLSARLPYGVQCEIGGRRYGPYTFVGDDVKDLMEGRMFKPYLRSMDDMTKDEIEELKELCSIYIPTDSPNIGFEDYGIIVFTHHLTNNTYSFKLNISVIDWLLEHHFDYRGLIERGLAIEALEGMYK